MIGEDNEKRLRTIIEHNFLASLMNTTKWIEALDVLDNLNVYYRIKLITESDPSPWLRHLQYGNRVSYLPRGWFEGYYSPTLTLEIEWLEIQSVAAEPVERIKEIGERFHALGIPFEGESNVIRIVGHVRR